MKNRIASARAAIWRTRWNTNSPSKLALAFGLTLAAASGARFAVQPAAAQPEISASAPGVHVPAPPPSGTRPFLAPAVSSYLAGYQITEPGISRATLAFTVPPMNCPTTDSQGTAAGIGNEQNVGSPTLLGIVFLACISGSPQYTVEALAGGNASFGSASPGDRLSLMVTQTPTKVTSTVVDVTGATTVTATGVPGPDNSLTYGLFPLFSGGMLPVADFGTLRMLRPTLENADLQLWSPTGLIRKNGTTLQISTGVFNNASGAFALVFRHN